MTTQTDELAETGIVYVVVPPEIETTPEARAKLAECEEFLNSIPDLDTRMKLWSTLQGSIDRIAAIKKNYPESVGKLYWDHAPLSFGFAAGSLCGGLIFHGPHDGYGSGQGPTFSVCLEPTTGWQLHT
jgi:hypothetical protein